MWVCNGKPWIFLLFIFLIAQLVKNLPAMQETGLIPGSGRSPGEGIGYPLQYSWASLVAQVVKNLPAMWDTWVWSLGWEEPLEKEMATRYSILAWKIPWTEEPGRPQSMGLQSRTWLSNFAFSFFGLQVQADEKRASRHKGAKDLMQRWIGHHLQTIPSLLSCK